MSDFNGMSVAEMKAALEEKAVKLELHAQFLELQQKEADLNARAASLAEQPAAAPPALQPPASSNPAAVLANGDAAVADVGRRKKRAAYAELARKQLTPPLDGRFTLSNEPGVVGKLLPYHSLKCDDDGDIFVAYNDGDELTKIGSFKDVASRMADTIIARDAPVEAVCLLRYGMTQMRTEMGLTNEDFGKMAVPPPHTNPIKDKRVCFLLFCSRASTAVVDRADDTSTRTHTPLRFRAALAAQLAVPSMRVLHPPSRSDRCSRSFAASSS